MKLVIIIVVVLVLLGGGLFGAITFAPDLVPAPIRNLLGVTVEEPAEPTEPPPPENTALIDMEPLTIPIFEDGDIDRFLVIHMLLEVEVGDSQAYVTAQMPRIIDAILTHVHALASLDIEPGIADRQFLKERLLAKLDETIGNGYVVDILFQNLFERPLG